MTSDDKPFKFYGAFASIGAYGLPQVKAPQYSSSLIWLENSMDKHQFNILSAGWSVIKFSPSLILFIIYIKIFAYIYIYTMN